MNFSKLLIPIVVISVISSLSSQAQDRKSRKEAKEKEKVEKAADFVDTLLVPVPNNRWMFVDRVRKSIKGIDAKDGVVDGIVENTDPAKAKLLTQAFITIPNQLIIKIENSAATHNQKIGYHRVLEDKLNEFRQLTSDNIDAVYYKQLMDNFSGMLLSVINDNSLDFVKKNATIYSLENIAVLGTQPEAKAYVYKTVGIANPELMLTRLKEIANEPYTDEIVAAAARIATNKVLSYAAPSSKFRYIIARNPDKLVKTIVSIADRTKTSFKVIPFVNQINDGEITIEAVEKLASNDDAYFKGLVNLLVSGKAISNKEIEKEIANSALGYVRTVNELHERTDAVRFRSIEGFEPIEYYFILLGGETNEIYTSSYLGIFKRMMVKIGKDSGYDLLKKVKMAKFRTFIRMTAGYNTIAPFLATMTESEKTDLLRQFVGGLELGSRSDLEDAVDVADAFGSLTDEKLITFLRDEVKNNYERVYKDKSLTKEQQEKGVIVYGLLASIFNSSASAENLQTAMENIPPINYVSYDALLDGQDKVVQQVFFYGDQDGQESYSYFLSTFRNKNWKIDESNPNWTVVSNLTGKPTVIYANKPLTPEPKDEEAQKKLYEYLDANNIKPTIVIHRGHSYHLEGSLKNLTPDVKIVMLGSCGGFHNLSNVLDKAPDANIISTKQIGTHRVNDPIIKRLNEDIVAGKNVDWISIWSDLGGYFSSRGADEKGLFSDYIPPNRNLGAIFIKAYRKIELSGQS